MAFPWSFITAHREALRLVPVRGLVLWLNATIHYPQNLASAPLTLRVSRSQAHQPDPWVSTRGCSFVKFTQSH